MENNKEKYVDNVQLDSLVAFCLIKGQKKLISGKITGIREHGVVTIQTKNGTNYSVPRENIAWVNTSGRWPKGVMDAFKIHSELEEESEEDGKGTANK